MNLLKPEDLFDLEGFHHRDLFAGVNLVWEALPKLKAYLLQAIAVNPVTGLPLSIPLRATLVVHEGKLLQKGIEIIPGDATKGKMRVVKNGKVLEGASVLYAGCVLADEGIAIGRGIVVEPGALIKGPTIIGDQTEVRQGAYIRGTCLVGAHCIVGHTTEIKNSIMLDGAKAGHFAYMGDSILGSNCNLGAGTKLANLKLLNAPITIRIQGKEYPTLLRKLGAILGDGVQTGCNSVTNPGTILGQRSLVYPNTTVKSGYYPPGSVIR